MLKQKLSSHLLTVSALILLALGASFLSNLLNREKQVTVFMDDEGFQPATLRIKAGEEVKFENIGRKPHWPASNFHPTHTLYPEAGGCLGSKLDACQALKTGESFSFIFNQVGTWPMHDHLEPGMVMVVEVTPFLSPPYEGGDEEGVIPSASAFRGLAYPEQLIVITNLTNEDAVKAWQYLKEAVIVEGHVHGNVHEFSHIIGNKLYEDRGLAGMSACDEAFAFGCYHGVTEEALTEQGTSAIREIQNSCLAAFPSQQSGKFASCIHGMGHGLLGWENFAVEPALADCDELDPAYRTYCYDGVFMENSANAELGWQFCANLPESYHVNCARYQALAIVERQGLTPSALGKFCEEGPDQTLQNTCFESLGYLAAQDGQGAFEHITATCRALEQDAGFNLCTIGAAREVVFQKYASWEEASTKLCLLLSAGWRRSCQETVQNTIKAYQPTNHPEVRGRAEIEQIKTSQNIDEQVQYYKKLIERVGPIEAQEALYRSGLPFTGETHLLNHTVGDWLYEQYGAAGLPNCKEYFLASCYHGFVLHAIAAGGMPEVKKVMRECESGGVPIIIQCSHAIGHGFLTAVGYKNLLAGLTRCDQAAKEIPSFTLYNCHDGVFMENIWGVHDGQPSADRWVKENDLIYPCDDPRIGEQYRDACWSNQPGWIYQKTNGDLKKVGEVCQQIVNASNRQTCFNGLGRQIHSLAGGNMAKTFHLCALLPTSDWVNYCVSTNATAAFSVGDHKLPFLLCSQIANQAKPTCYRELFGSMKIYATSPRAYGELCHLILELPWQKECAAFEHN